MASISPFGIPGVGPGIIHPMHTDRTHVELIGRTTDEYNSYAYSLVAQQLSQFVVDYANDVIRMVVDTMVPHAECDDFESVVRMVVQNLDEVRLYYFTSCNAGNGGWYSPQHMRFTGGVIKHQLARGPEDEHPILQHDIEFVYDKMLVVNRPYVTNALGNMEPITVVVAPTEPQIDTSQPAVNPNEQ